MLACCHIHGAAESMSNILKFIRPDAAFDPDTLTILGDVYERACTQYCSVPAGPTCDAMADRIFAAATNGERDPDKLWKVAIGGTCC